MKNFCDRMVRQPVYMGAAVNAIFLATFRSADNLTQLAVASVIALFVKMYSTSTKNIEDERTNSRNQALAEVDSLALVADPPVVPGD